MPPARARVLLLTGDVGGAHRAVEESLREGLGSECEVRSMDLLAATSRFCRGCVGLYPHLLRRSSHLYNAIYDLAERPAVRGALHRVLLSRLCASETRQILRQESPDVVVSLFPLIGSLVADALEGGGRDVRAPLVVLVVDLATIHPAWAEPRAALTLVADETARRRLREAGVPEERLRVVRYPVRRRVHSETGATRGETSDGSAVRRVLLMGGGEGALDMVRIAGSLLDGRENLEIHAAPGRHRALRRRLERLAASHDGRLRVVASWPEVPARLRACDLVVTKPGPSTIMEAIAAEVPLLLTGFVPRQEEGNVRYVEERDLGEYVRVSSAAEAVLRLLSNGGLHRYRAAMRREKIRQTTHEAAEAIRGLLVQTRGRRR